MSLRLLKGKRARVALAVCLMAVAGVIGGALASRSAAPDVRYHSAHVTVGGEVYRYLAFVPSSYRAADRVPLVVVLHGCRTTADQQALASGYNEVAQRRGFIVLYPDVDATDQMEGGCWKGIWDPRAEGRGRGDARAVAAMTSAVMHRWRIDPARVYAIGISAGAFETAILGASYPDLYAAIGIHSGAAYGGGEPGCVTSGESPAGTRTLALAALAAMARHARVMPVIVFHGDRDLVIPYACGQAAVQQWLETDNLVLGGEHRPPLPTSPTSLRPGTVTGGLRYTVASYLGGDGCAVIQFWTVHGMGHAWSGGSGDPSIALYTDPQGPSAAAASSAFFLRWSLHGPTGICRTG